MSKTVPTTYTAPTVTDMLAGRKVEVADWRSEIRGLHHLWSRTGARCPLILRTSTPWETTSATYTQTDEAATDTLDLDATHGVLRLTRELLLPKSTHHRVVLAVFGQDLDAQVTLFAPDGNTTLGTIAASCSTSWEWATGTLDITRANAREGGSASNPPRVIGAKIEGRTSLDTGYLWQAYLFEAIGTASQLPDGS